MKNSISVKKQICLQQHEGVIKQRTRKGYTPGDQEGIFYSLWCKDCDHHLTMISHDQAWYAKKAGLPFVDLKYKITNSTYKNIVKSAASAQLDAFYKEQASSPIDNWENHRVGPYD